MELRILRYFLAVAREENITKAAELLHITQPTLSRQLAQLEEDVGVTLFSRGARKVTLTDEGMLLRRRAEEIVDLADKTEKELTERDELINGVVSVGCGELASVQVIAEMFRAFKEKYPAVTYELYAGNADYTNERIEKGLSDIALFLEPVDIDRYDFIRLGVKERWAVLLPSSIMVQNGLGYAFHIEGSRPFLDRSQVCSLPLYPELAATTVLAWKKRQPFSVTTTKFIEFAKNFVKTYNNRE